MSEAKDLLLEARTIAIVGCSDRPFRTSHHIAQYLQNAGYRIIPVNPNIAETLGEKAYPDLQSLPTDVEVDVVNIFRNPAYTTEMVQQAVNYATETGIKPLIWTQLGVSTPRAQQLAEEADLPYVVDRCIMVEHGRWVN